MPGPKIPKSSSGVRGVGPQADFFTLTGAQSPGFAKLLSCNAAQSWDLRKAFGTNWATLVPAGEELSKVSFEVWLWTADDSTAFDAYALAYLQRPVQTAAGTDPSQVKALSFTHDQASAPPYNVTAVVVADVVYMNNDDGIVKHRVEFIEWKQPLPAPPAPNQATPASPNGPPAATDALGAETNQITSQADALEDQLALQRDQ
jgi:hypothetical protein